MTKPFRVSAVVPTYFPDNGTLGRISALLSQVDEVFVVDDGTSPALFSTIDWQSLTGVIILRHSSNRGIAAALNTGVEVALAAGADYVLTVDQDTQLPPGYVKACLEVFSVAAAATPRVDLGVVAAGSINGSPVLPHATVAGIGLMRYAIQSGMLISGECFRRCGFFDERLVIDVVDTEFCLRAWRCGMMVAAALGTDIDHELGRPMPARIFGIRRARNGQEKTYEYHPPFRQYYMSRNGLDVALRYLRIQPRWSLSSIRQDLVNFGVGFAAGPHRARHAAAAALGVVHGIVRHRGMLSPWWRRRLDPRPHSVED